MCETDLAWAAGFVDGEGCIALIYHKRPIKDRFYECYALRISVTNTDMRCLERLKGMFGGSINGLRHKDRPNNKPCWTWYCTSANAERALRALLPYLFSKKEQAAAGLESRKYIQTNGLPRTEESRAAQAAILSQLKRLKRAA